MNFESTSVLIVPATGLQRIFDEADISITKTLFNTNYAIEAALTGAIHFIHYDIDPWQYFELLLKVGDDNGSVQREITNEIAALADSIVDYIVVFENGVAEYIANSSNVTFSLCGNTAHFLKHGFFKIKVTPILDKVSDNDTRTG